MHLLDLVHGLNGSGRGAVLGSKPVLSPIEAKSLWIDLLVPELGVAVQIALLQEQTNK